MASEAAHLHRRTAWLRPGNDPLARHKDRVQCKTRRRVAVRLRALALLLCVTAALGGCTQGVLDPQGPIADGERLILLDALGIMLLIAVPTILATLWFAWWFRASNRAALYRPTWVYSDKLEVIVWAIPALVFLFLGGVAWIGSHQLDPARRIESSVRPLQVQVVSLDW